MNWWEEFPDQYANEIEGLRELGIIENETNSSGFLKINFILKKDNKKLEFERDYHLVIKFPVNYPFFRPQVYADDLNLPRHQSPVDGNLCLLARPSDNWDVGKTVAELLIEKFSVVLERGTVTEPNELAKMEDEQAEPISEYYSQSLNLQILTDIDFNALTFLKPSNQIEEIGNVSVKLRQKIPYFQFDHPKEKDNFLRFEVVECQSDELPNNSISTEIFGNQPSNSYKIPWYKLKEFPRLRIDSTNESNKDNIIYNWLKSELKSIDMSFPSGVGVEIKGGNLAYIIALTFPEEVAKDKIGWQTAFLVVFSKRGSKKRNIKGFEKSFLTKPTPIGSDLFSVRIPYFKELQKKKVMLFGLGTLGAPVAIDLARNGIGDITIIDFDISESGPSVRWPLGQEYFGVLKPFALADYIGKNYPLTKINPIVHRIGFHDDVQQFTSDSEIKEMIKSFDLIIDATAEEGVNHFLSYYSRRAQVPFISLEARAGIWGGLIYVDKLEDNACWMCFRYYLGQEIERPLQDPSGNIQAIGCGDLTFNGSSFDLNQISSEGIRMAVSLLSKTSSEYAYGDLDWNISVLSLIDTDNRERIAPNWKTYNMHKHPNCPYCNESKQT